MISTARTMQESENGAVCALLAGLLDDAAVFPPQQASMADAVREHAVHRAGGYGAFQGALVVPARRLPELLSVPRDHTAALRLSLVVEYGDAASIAAARSALARASTADVAVRMVEVRLPSAAVPVEDLQRACEEWRGFADDGAAVDVYLESAAAHASLGEARALAAKIAALRDIAPGFVGGKLRCGGLTSEALPASESVARFIVAMREHAVAWKATAGLHHPLRGRYGGATMHGFLNLFVATLGAHAATLGFADLVDVLEDSRAANFRLAGAALGWRETTFDTAAIHAGRRDALHSIGSCSFDEPLEGLRELGMLA